MNTTCVEPFKIIYLFHCQICDNSPFICFRLTTVHFKPNFKIFAWTNNKIMLVHVLLNR